MDRSDRIARVLGTWIAAAAGAASIGCGDLEIPMSLVLEDTSEISILLPLPPPNDIATSKLVGGVDANMGVSLSLFNLLNPFGMLAVIEIPYMEITGTNLPLLGGLLNTGTLCVGLTGASGGTALIRIFQEEVDFSLTLDALGIPTDPTVLSLLPLGGFPFATDVEATETLTLADMIGLLFGTGGGLTVSQEINDVVDIPPLPPVDLVGQLVLSSADSIPVNAIWDAECTALFP